MHCFVSLYDCFRAATNPKSISHCPCTGTKPDIHEYYYQQFLSSAMLGVAGDVTPYLRLRAELADFISEANCGPILIRFAWHDSGTFDQRIKTWPECDGAIGSIRFDPEINFGANAGLTKTRTYLTKFNKKYPTVSWADLIQMASATAVEVMGGPVIPMKYGRVSAKGPEQCAGSSSRESFAVHAGLPDAHPPFNCGAATPAEHLRNVFTKKMGFSDLEIVALSGAHTVGRVFKDRSGACPFGYSNPTKYTSQESVVRTDGKPGVGMSGGQSWCKKWLVFDNEYFKVSAEKDPDLVWLPTDLCLTTDPGFQHHFDKFAADDQYFFQEYAKAHKKLSELGSKFEPAQGITL